MPADDQFARLAHDFRDGLKTQFAMTIRLHQDGSLSIEGATADKAFNLRLIDEARAALKRQPDHLLIVPGNDVDVRAQPAYGTAR